MTFLGEAFNPGVRLPHSYPTIIFCASVIQSLQLGMSNLERRSRSLQANIMPLYMSKGFSYVAHLIS